MALSKTRFQTFAGLLKEEKAKNKIFVLVGPPAVGKSTWIQSTFEGLPYIISRDDIVEQVANSVGLTYSDMFVTPPEDAQIGEIDEKYGEVVESPEWMAWSPTVFRTVLRANGRINSEFRARVAGAIGSNKDIVVDMTNMTHKSRKGALRAIRGAKDEYEKIAVVFEFEGAEDVIEKVAQKRAEAAQRMGKSKNIPSHVLQNMFQSFQRPEVGTFDKVISVDNRELLRHLANEPTELTESSSIGTADTVDGPYTHLTDKQPFELSDKNLEKLVHHYVKEALNTLLESKKSHKILYHIGPRPGRPLPFTRREDDVNDRQWTRSWIKSDPGSVIFMSDNWKTIWNKHGIHGNVYTYRISWEAIKDSGGLHRFSRGTEILIPDWVWKKYNLQNARLGKVIDIEKANELALKAHGGMSQLYPERRGKIWGKSRFTDFNTIIKHKPEKWPTIVKFLESEERAHLIEQIDKWLAKVDYNEYMSDITTKLRDMPGFKGIEARLRHGVELSKIKKKIGNAKKLKELLKNLE